MEGNISDSVTIHIRPSFTSRSLIPLSKTHLICACLCANNCKEIEHEFRDGNTSRDENDLFQEDIAYADGAVMASVAFMESTINEFLHNSEINQSEWKDFNLEGKYKFIYKKIFNDELDTESAIYNDFVNLIYLRNRLMHFKLKWQTTDPEEDDQYNLKQRLEDKFKKNLFREKTGNPYFPDKCLGAGCAEWSIRTSYEFLNMFSNEISDSGICLLKPFMIRVLQKYSFL